MHPDKLPVNKAGEAQLQEALQALALPPAPKTAVTVNWNGTYQLKPNKFNFTTATFTNSQLTLKNDTTSHQLNFGAGAWQAVTTQKPGPSLTAGAKEIRSMLFQLKWSAATAGRTSIPYSLYYAISKARIPKHSLAFFDAQGLTMHVANTVTHGETIIKGQRL